MPKQETKKQKNEKDLFKDELSKMTREIANLTRMMTPPKRSQIDLPGEITDDANNQQSFRETPAAGGKESKETTRLVALKDEEVAQLKETIEDLESSIQTRDEEIRELEEEISEKDNEIASLKVDIALEMSGKD